MVVGHAVSSFMLRQMEFDADRHEARLAGSNTFEDTVRRLAVLSVAAQGAQSDLGDFYREGRLGDDLPQLILANIAQLPQDVHAKINEMIGQAKTGLFDTHPTDMDRIANAKHENSGGIFRLADPASSVFQDFAGLSRTVTQTHYQHVLGAVFEPRNVHPTAELLERQAKEHEAYKAGHRFYQGQFDMFRPSRLPAEAAQTFVKAAPPAAPNAQSQLMQARQHMLDGLDTYAQSHRRYERARPAQRKLIEPELVDFERAAGARLAMALHMLHAPRVAERVDDAAQWQAESARLLPVLQAIDSQLDQTVELAEAAEELAKALNALSQAGENQTLIQGVRGHMQTTALCLGKLLATFGALDYPFEHASGKISIAKVAVPEAPAQNDPVATFEAARELLTALPRVKARALGRMCMAAERVEAAAGLPPLPEPPPAADDHPASD